MQTRNISIAKHERLIFSNSYDAPILIWLRLRIPTYGQHRQ